ncbi:hypothetical protein CH251_14120 [Rhodococcus sp. 06-462-5]|uniref:TerD family protein n=1 Tax=unclassified Rhodococcus (in: high G+C Gram-positive bacteria) TaxID=192944 RepID=UPI000B9C0D52|nr:MULTISPECIES: TerD family protein [unclassified Rhodococcus (in: high G+C Gram-positive bacteria)]OZC73662.1 hypothetical protein CH251_14120 [Rhodococcus sp. 06-462-5]OZE63471.1 hypothetical protein CH270_18495 [Rhodococcus sp. 02-925g]
MQQLQMGQNCVLGGNHLSIEFTDQKGASDAELMAVLVGRDSRARSDEDLVFFNRVSSPCQGVVLAGARQIELRLDRLSVDVPRVVVAVADGGTSAGRTCFDGGVVSVRSDEGFDAIHQLGGLTSERCVVLVEVYRARERWKLRAVSQGWSDGVSAFVESYGIEVDSDADARVDGGEAGSVAVSMIVVPDQFAGDPIGSGEVAWRKKRAGESLNKFDELHAVEYEAGLVRGTHFLKWGEEVARLKREGHLVEALEMLLEVIAATEREQAQEHANAPVRAAYFGRPVEEIVVRETPPGWTHNAAIVYRKLGDLRGEIAVVDRWLAHAGDSSKWVGATHAKLIARRQKAFELLQKSSG